MRQYILDNEQNIDALKPTHALLHCKEKYENEYRELYPGIQTTDDKIKQRFSALKQKLKKGGNIEANLPQPDVESIVES